jgi:chitinase
LLLAFIASCNAAATSAPTLNSSTPTLTPGAAVAGTRAATFAPATAPATTTPATSVSESPTVSSTLPPSTGAPPASPRLVGYFFGSDRNNRVSDIDAAHLTDIIYAFADVTIAGECASIEPALDQVNFPQLRELKRQHPQLKTLLSVGGYSHSTYFSGAAMTPDSRSHFVRTCVQFMKQNGLDGIDVDWELPVKGGQAGNQHSPEDRQNLTALLAEFRSQLDALGANDNEHYLVTIAAPAGPTEYANLDLTAIPQYLDWINLETYALYAANSPMTNFNSPLYPSSSNPEPNSTKRLKDNGDGAVSGYLAAGVPANKILLGVPFYGRGWKGVPNVNDGLYQSNGGAATDAGVPKGTWSDGAILYGALEKYYLGTWSRHWQAEAEEPWLYNPGAGIMITFEDPQSLGVKGDYVRSHHLGGVMIWHLSADDGQHALLNALCARLFP